MKYTALILMLTSVISRIFGFIREILMSNYYGTSQIADVVVIALAVPTVIFAFLFSSLNTSFIPAYNNIKINSGSNEAERFTSNLSNVVMVISIALCLLGILFAEPLVFAMASGFSGEKFEITVNFVRIAFIGCTFNSIAAIFSGYLNIKGSYVLPSLRLGVQNVILIIFTLLSVRTNVYMLAIGILVSTIFQNIVIVLGLKKVGYRHRYTIDIGDKNIKYIIILALPMMLGVAVDQINMFVDKTLASRVIDGGVSILNYADRINALVYIVVTSIVTVAYPAISKYAIEKNDIELKRSVFKFIQIILIFCMPVIAAFIVFAEPIVEIIYERGAFSHSDTLKVAACLMVYSLTIFGVSIREIVSRTFYSLGDSRTPVKNGMIMVIVNSGLSIILSKYLGLVGIAYGTAISSILGSFILTYLLRKKIGKLNIKNFAKNTTIIAGISTLMIALSKLLYDWTKMSLDTEKSFFITVVFGMTIYFALIILFNISNSRSLVYKIIGKIGKKAS
ncbi:murein biosynthesis integral membrane protein MurJ [Peptostreptococcus porci]|uniref:murein biosynthesis integral membrane protein MurJ n=1 Tax=Peptostreptococcus porci TaxID=2652282 RepID=UPI002A7EE730|nr:murein biosynthesis integral membrane protein MurJ [Peptostreptococcus porci]MDY4127927.1 murein biosynthesis integral membrane protein MurJ [Peptostreptococcus porci]